MRIDALKAKLSAYDGVLPLPVIRNNKTVDPTDPTSEPVIQLETAMGAAVTLFDGATCVCVDRMRFLPVKTTDDLFIMRSDRFHLTDQYEMEDGNYVFPDVHLDARYYKNIMISIRDSLMAFRRLPRPIPSTSMATGPSAGT